jgi:hypothetical protein
VIKPEDVDDPTVYRMGGKDVTLRQVAKPQGRDETFSVCAAEATEVPIYYVSWEDAVEFCKRLTQREKAAKRLPRDAVYALPTESQWEYACRAGTTTTTYAGAMEVLGKNNVPVLHGIAWYGGNSSVKYGGRGWEVFYPERAFGGRLAGPRRVGQLQPNAWQLKDMLGNLYEWVEDYSGYYPQRDVSDPTGPTKGEKKLFRGGAWNHYGTMCRAARRFEDIPTIRLNYIGFRVALRLCGSREVAWLLIRLQKPPENRLKFIHCGLGPQLPIRHQCAVERSMLGPVGLGWDAGNNRADDLFCLRNVGHEMTDHSLGRDRFFFDFPAIVVGDHCQGGEGDLGFTREFGLGKIGHADDVETELAVSLTFRASRKGRSVHASIDAAIVNTGTCLQSFFVQQSAQACGNRIAKGNVRHDSAAEKGVRNALAGSIKELVRQHNVTRVILLLQRAHGGDCDDPPHIE